MQAAEVVRLALSSVCIGTHCSDSNQQQRYSDRLHLTVPSQRVPVCWCTLAIKAMQLSLILPQASLCVLSRGSGSWFEPLSKERSCSCINAWYWHGEEPPRTES